MADDTKGLIPVGRYLGRALPGWKLGSTKNEKTVLEVPFELYDRDVTKPDGSVVKGTKYSGWKYFFFSEGAAKRSVQSLKWMGYKGNKLSDFTDGVSANLSANEVEVEVQHEVYEGKTRHKLEWVNKPGTGGMNSKPMTSDRIEQETALLAGIFDSFDDNGNEISSGDAANVASAKRFTPPNIGANTTANHVTPPPPVSQPAASSGSTPF